VWETAVFVVNVLAFVLMGLQARPIIESPALNCASAHSLGNFRVGSILLKKILRGVSV
jgi:NhaP-type Na+/H+ or K+/H+ antiporter